MYLWFFDIRVDGFSVAVKRMQESLCIQYSSTQLNTRNLLWVAEITGVGKRKLRTLLLDAGRKAAVGSAATEFV